MRKRRDYLAIRVRRPRKRTPKAPAVQEGLLTLEQLAKRWNRSVQWLRDHWAELPRYHFPNHWHVRVIDQFEQDPTSVPLIGEAHPSRRKKEVMTQADEMLDTVIREYKKQERYWRQ